MTTTKKELKEGLENIGEELKSFLGRFGGGNDTSYCSFYDCGVREHTDDILCLVRGCYEDEEIPKNIEKKILGYNKRQEKRCMKLDELRTKIEELEISLEDDITEIGKEIMKLVKKRKK